MPTENIAPTTPADLNVRSTSASWPYLDAPLPAQVTRDRLELLTEEDLAAALNLEPTTIASWRRDGNGPVATKLGKQIFYQLEDVRDWLTKQSSKSQRVHEALERGEYASQEAGLGVPGRAPR